MKPTLGTATSIDRQSHRRADGDYLAALGGHPDTRTIVLVDLKPVFAPAAAGTGTLRWFTPAEIATMGLDHGQSIFLGVEHRTGAGRFAQLLSDARAQAVPAAETRLMPVGEVRQLAGEGALTPDELSLAGLAKALGHWHDSCRCCGHCGGATVVTDAGWRRKCQACGRDHFPRTDPVVIMLIVDPAGERCLLGRAPRFPEGMYSTLAGFVEPGEDIEHAVRRETLEETAIEVGVVRFHSAQPWPFPQSLMIGCLGQATSTEITVDPHELVDARWFSRDEARLILEGRHPDGITGPGRQAIARVLLGAFVHGTPAP